MNADLTQQLINRCRSKDRQAQAEVFRLTVPRIHKLLSRIVGQTEDINDLVQETYICAFTRLPQYDGQAAFTTWLYRIAINHALQFLRRKKWIGHKLLDYWTEKSRDDRGTSSLHDHDVDSSLGALSEEDRAILLLRYQEKMNYRNIAEVLECSEGTVASRLNRARNRLRKRLAENSTKNREGIQIDQHLNRLEQDHPVIPSPELDRPGFVSDH